MTCEGRAPTVGPVAQGPDVPPAVRAQILATEHWSLLATRSMTWSEVMSRISILLTIESASLVVVGLTVQVAGFGHAFHVLAVGLSAAMLVLGTLTGIRVANVMTDDESMVIGMNRLRAAYVDLDPGVAPYLVTGITDDLTGVRRTYGMTRTRGPSHFIGSTGLFMIAVNAIVAGVFGALVTDACGGNGFLIALVGSVCLVSYAAAFLTMTLRDYRRAAGRNPPAFPS